MSRCSAPPRPLDLRNANAGDVLDPALLARVQRALGGRGACLWVPSLRADEARTRAARVIALKRAGRSAREIAEDVGLTERRVYQIVRESALKAEPDAAG